MLTYHADDSAAACTCEWKGKGNREGTEWLQENNKMEIKQLEYFAAAVEYGSLNRAAEKLYTTQPNVSRVLNSLEKELHVTLLERSNKGIKMTPQGEELYGHAMSILKHSNVIRSMSERPNGRRFSVSGYRSGLLTKLMVQLYQGGREQLKYEYREGTVEEITDNVAARLSEIGIVYFAEAQMPCFQHIMWHKKLEFHKLALRGICVYVGENHPLYERESIRFSELKGMKFVTETEDFFAMEHHIERISVGAFISEQHMNDRFYTNSDYMINNLLLHSDVCCLGIDIVPAGYQKYGIKALKIEDCEPFLAFGFVAAENASLSAEAERYLEKLNTYL